MLIRYDIEDIKNNISPEVFPNFCKMIQLVLTLPISSATCKRSFSAENQNMAKELSILFIEKDKTYNDLNNVTILNTFNKRCDRLIKLS